MTTALARTPTTMLTALDRCDRCGAQAVLRAVLSSGELVFCGHHARRFEPALRQVAVRLDPAAGAT